jgi:hypothetical protein
MTDLVKEWRSRGFVVRSGAEFVEEGGPPFPTNVSVIFTQIEVLDDASLFGPGSWTVNATVSGTGQSLLAARSVDTGDRIALTQTVAKTIAPGGDLVIRVDGTDSAGTADALGVAAFRFNAGSTPPFGVGVQSRTSSTGNYKITLEIRVVP